MQFPDLITKLLFLSTSSLKNGIKHVQIIVKSSIRLCLAIFLANLGASADAPDAPSHTSMYVKQQQTNRRADQPTDQQIYY